MFVTFITISHLVKLDHYRDTRAAILDPCIQGIFYIKTFANLEYQKLSLVKDLALNFAFDKRRNVKNLLSLNN